jgi:hypothetical protein
MGHDGMKEGLFVVVQKVGEFGFGEGVGQHCDTREGMV